MKAPTWILFPCSFVSAHYYALVPLHTARGRNESALWLVCHIRERRAMYNLAGTTQPERGKDDHTVPPRPRVGRHMPTNARPVKAARIARDIGCSAIQVFASNPTGWRPPADDPAGNAAFAQAARECQLDPVVIHAPYLINLASPDVVIWEKSLALLQWTLQRGALLGAAYVVFHTGSHRGTGVEAGIARIVEAIERILPLTPPQVVLLLENDVGAGNSLGHSFEQLGAVLAVLPQYSERLGVCLDTAHLWGAGHDISTVAATREVLRRFDAAVGLSRLKVVHLNDTQMALGSHRDVHCRLGEGIIGEEGLRALLRDARLSQAAVLLETPIKIDDAGKEDWEHDKGQIAKARELLTGAKDGSIDDQGERHITSASRGEQKDASSVDG